MSKCYMYVLCISDTQKNASDACELQCEVQITEKLPAACTKIM